MNLLYTDDVHKYLLFKKDNWIFRYYVRYYAVICYCYHDNDTLHWMGFYQHDGASWVDRCECMYSFNVFFKKHHKSVVSLMKHWPWTSKYESHDILVQDYSKVRTRSVPFIRTTFHGVVRGHDAYHVYSMHQMQIIRVTFRPEMPTVLWDDPRRSCICLNRDHIAYTSVIYDRRCVSYHCPCKGAGLVGACVHCNNRYHSCPVPSCGWFYYSSGLVSIEDMLSKHMLVHGVKFPSYVSSNREEIVDGPCPAELKALYSCIDLVLKAGAPQRLKFWDTVTHVRQYRADIFEGYILF